MRMLEASRKLDLALEPLGAQGGSELRVEDLQRDKAVVPEIPSQVDNGHPPAAEFTLDRVAAARAALSRGSSSTRQALESRAQLHHGARERARPEGCGCVVP